MYPLPSIKQAVQEEHITAESKVVTPLIPNLIYYQTNWPEVAANSWLKRYFVQQESAS